MISGGFGGSILTVDLSANSVKRAPLPPDLAEDYIGGLGLCVKLFYDHMIPSTEPLAPENVIVIGAGPLVGTDLPGASRVYAVTKLPTSRTIGWCGAGGVTFGCLLKNAGVDHIIISGRADHPVYLEIIDGEARLRDAAHLWGRTVEQTCTAVWNAYPAPTGIMAIGPGGENQVAFSMALIDRMATLGRGGFGAVMGSKRLKGMVVRGSRGVTVADRKHYRTLRKKIVGEIEGYPYLEEWRQLGMMKSFPMVPQEEYFNIKKKRAACVSCPVGCKDVVEIPDGQGGERLVYTSSAINLYTPVIYGLTDHLEAIRLVAELDDQGLDMFEFLGLVKFAKDLKDNGLISLAPSEPEPAMDSFPSLMAWVERVANRQGLGDLLAGGFSHVSAQVGAGAAELAPALVKGMHPYAGPGAALPWNLFGTMELGQVLDPRGPHVGSGGSPTYFARRPVDVVGLLLGGMGVWPEDLRGILPESEETAEKMSFKVGRLLKYSHRWFSILGSLGVCARAQINRFYNADFCAEAYQAVTGIETDLDRLRRRAERAWTLLRQANVLDGFLRENLEVVPDQWFREGGFQDYFTGDPLTRENADEMIADYYREWGWDGQTGRPTPETLVGLGLNAAPPQV